MHVIDAVIVSVYLAAALWIGRRLSGRQRTTRDYFLTGRSVPWWAVMASIVATETSTVTLISVPGYAFGGDLTFLQIAIGYIVGRLFVSLVLIPPYFRGDILTAYQLLGARVGRSLGRAAAVIFLATRNVSDGLRLFATGVMLAAVLTSAGAVAPAGDDLLVIVSVCGLAAVTVTYTWLGGMTAVVWMDLVQLTLYLAGSLVAIAMLSLAVPGGPGAAWALAGAAGKLRMLDFTLDVTRDYTFWSAVAGGAFFTAATHGTDQMFVQRYLCCRSAADARRALVVSGFVIFLQFALFLGIGLLLWAYHLDPAGPGMPGLRGADGVFPAFIAAQFPVGLKGVMLAAVIAAAMSTLSSSLNSSASSVIGDFYAGRASGPPADRRLLHMSRVATLGCAVIQVAVALTAIEFSQRVIDDVLQVQFFTGGVMLGVFLLSVVGAATATAGLAGLAGGLVAVGLLSVLTGVSWQWYTLVGSLATVGVGSLVHRRR